MYRSQELMKKAMDANIKIAELVQKSTLDQTERTAKLEGLKDSMKVYCAVDNSFKKYEVCEHELERRRTPVDSEKNQGFEELLQEVSKNKEDPTKHNMYRKLEEVIRMREEVKNDDLEIQDTAPNTICPVSKVTMKSPMTNKLCGHIYDKSSVQQLLKLHKKGIRCPVPGCMKALKFTYSDLEPNNTLKKYISQLES